VKNSEKVKNQHKYFVIPKNVILKFTKNNAFSSYLVFLIKKMPKMRKIENFTIFHNFSPFFPPNSMQKIRFAKPLVGPGFLFPKNVVRP